jgi:hypothetical protein
MSDPNAASAPAPAGSGWTPKETINVMIGKQNTNVYPRVQPLWPIEERAYAYHVTKTALQSLHLPTDVYLDNLGMYLDSQTTVAGLKCDFLEYFEDHWLDMGNLSILSFHTSAGAVIDASIPGDINVLRPVQNGAVANCRPADVRYVRLECVLDYADLAEHAGPNDNTILRTVYYLELPQTVVVVLDGHNNPRNLRTFHGAADLRTLTVQQIQDDILDHVPQDAPIGLAEAPFNVTNATVDDTIMEHITRSILKLSLATMETAIFQQLCPNYTDKPHAAVEGITQTYLDPEGNIVTHTVAQYNSFLSNASRTFAHQREYPVDLCSIFIRGLHPDVKSVFEEMYPNHSAPHDRSGRAQRTALAEILRIASTAESRVLSTQRLVARQMGQTFIAGTYASQADERTMSQYQGPGGAKSDKSGDSSPAVTNLMEKSCEKGQIRMKLPCLT